MSRLPEDDDRQPPYIIVERATDRWMMFAAGCFWGFLAGALGGWLFW